MNTRKKLGLIFGTPIFITLILVAVYYSKVQEKIEPVISHSDMTEEAGTFKTTEGWSTYEHPTEGFLIDLPPGSTIAPSTGENVTMTFRPADFDAPIVNINIEEWHDDKYESLANMKQLSNVEINGLKGRLRIDEYDADEMGPGSTCAIYRLEHDGMFYSLSTYECLEWEHFENVVKSFRFQ